MKSHAFLLGAAVSLVSAAAFAADPYWENRDPNPAATQSSTDPDTAAKEAKAACQKEAAQCEQEAAAIGSEPAATPVAEPVPAPVPAPVNPRMRTEPRPANLVSRIGISAEAGGGVGGFIANEASQQTTTAGQWDLRMVFGTRRHFAGEAAYIGNAQGVETLGVSSGATLTGNGLEGTFRFNFLTGDWQPYAVAGLGYMHYSMSNAIITTSDIDTAGNVATFPLGGGLAWRKNGIVLDARLNFHPATRSDVLREASMSTWGVNAKAGFEF